MNTYTAAVDTLAKDWFRRCRESQRVHYEYASALERRHLRLGIPAIGLSTIVGTAVFSSWESASQHLWLRITFGLFSMLAAATAAFQTFLNLSDRAAKHKAAGASYGAIRRELELLKTLPPEAEEEMRQRIENIKRSMDELAASAPSIPSQFKQQIDDQLKSRRHDRIFKLNPRGQPEAEDDAMSNEGPLLELRKKAIDTTIEWSKQITALATGTLVLSGTFIKDLFTGHVKWPVMIVMCWLAMSLSAVLGVLYFGALVAMVGKAKGADDLDVYAWKNGRSVAIIHVIAFMVGVIGFVTFITKNML